EHRKCFACHHQTLPMLAVIAADKAGVLTDRELIEAQAAFTRKSFSDQLDQLRQGKGIGGRALTVSYGLWAFDLAKSPGDELTEAMVSYLLKTQKEVGPWEVQTRRPPMEESSLTCTVLAVAGMQKYRDAKRKEEI